MALSSEMLVADSLLPPSHHQSLLAAAVPAEESPEFVSESCDQPA